MYNEEWDDVDTICDMNYDEYEEYLDGKSYLPDDPDLEDAFDDWDVPYYDNTDLLEDFEEEDKDIDEEARQLFKDTLNSMLNDEGGDEE